MTLIPLLLAAALSAGNAEFDEAAKVGAMDIVTARECVRLRDMGPAKGVLKDRMLAAPGEYDSLDKARAAAKEDYRKSALFEYNRSRAEVARRFGLTYTELVDPSAFLTDGWEAVFDRRFAEERESACAEQAKGIVAKVKPAEADFGKKDEAAIRAGLVAAVVGQQRFPVFEENRRYISEAIVDPILESAKKEQVRQRDFLWQARSEAFAPSVIAKEIVSELEKDLGVRGATVSADAVVWGVFPGVVGQTAAEVSKKRVLDRLAAAVDDVALTLEAGRVREAIADDPKRHRKASASEAWFGDWLNAGLASNAIARVVSAAPDAERDELSGYAPLRGREGAFGSALSARIRRDLLPRVREIRGEIAAEDAVKHWPALMDGTWFPEAAFADDICSRSDYSKAVRRWRSLSELASLAAVVDRKTVLEETEDLVDGRIARAFDLARSAINAQNAALDGAVPGVLEEAKSRKSSWFARTPDYDMIVALLTERVEAKWDETRVRVLWEDGEKPANAEVQHRTLFPSVRKRIELVAKTILEEMEKPEPEPQTPEPSEPEPEEIAFTVSVKKTGDRIETRILKGQAPVFERECPATRRDFKSVSSALSDKLIDVLELK